MPEIAERKVVEMVEAAARQVRGRLRGLSTKGLCRDVCLATAFASSACGEPIAMCYGTIRTSSHEDAQEHWWLRYGQMIIDPTADQFELEGEVLVKNEADASAPRYQEQFYFCVQTTRVLQLAGLAGPP